MKVLLSAYACEPDKGSEPGVGWNWARALVKRGYAVHLITRSNNQPSIDVALATEKIPLAVSYYDLPAWARKWKKRPGGIYIYYLLWQLGAYRLAKALHAKENFDRVQHSTFASFRQPSFMGGLGIPFIFGPVGGGEPMPSSFRPGVPFAARIIERLRDIGSSLTSFDPMMLHTFSSATLIACTTSDTLAKIPTRFHEKCIVQQAIGINDSEICPPPELTVQAPRFLYIGRLLYWKGIHLALRALAEVRVSVPTASMMIIGDGSDREWLKGVAAQAGVADAVEWVAALPHEEILRQYYDKVAFVFPSLHDSGGMVVLEALASGLPVVCLNLGGPGVLVNRSCGLVIEARQHDEASVVKSLASAMTLLATNPALRARLAANTTSRARELTWDRVAERVHSSALLGVEHE